MEKKKRDHKKYRFTYIKATVGTLFLCLFFLKGYTPFEETGENLFHIQVNGQDVGTLGDKERIDELLLQARKNVVAQNTELDKISVGCEVKVYDVEYEEEMDFRIVGSTEANSLQNKISNESPVGHALLGRKAGETVEVETQAGTIQYKILEIQRVS